MSKKSTAQIEGNKNEQIVTISPATGLTPQQEQACVLLASGESYTATAQRLNVSRGTLYKWQVSLAFQCYYNQQVKDYQAEVKNGLLGLHSEAVDTVRELMKTAGEATRLKAAIWLLERVEAVDVGVTDVRELLKNKHYKKKWDLGLDDGYLDTRAYNAELEELGLSDDV